MLMNAGLVGGGNVDDLLGTWNDGVHPANFQVVANPAVGNGKQEAQYIDPFTGQTRYLQFSTNETQVFQSAVPGNTTMNQVTWVGSFVPAFRMSAGNIVWPATLADGTPTSIRWFHPQTPFNPNATTVTGMRRTRLRLRKLCKKKGNGNK
jgi:hypothetical protein